MSSRARFVNSTSKMKLSLLALALTAGSAIADTTKGNAEVDVIFPRNDTFAPTPLLPVVFAIQNTAVASQLNLRLSYRVFPYGQPNATTDYEQIRLNGVPPNETTAYVNSFVGGLLDEEGTWEFYWQLRWNNCTAGDGGDTDFARDTEEPVNHFVFTTHKDGSKPDLVAASGGDKCGDTQGIGFEVQDVIHVPPPYNADQLTSCANIAVPTPTPTPCSASMATDAAESISASITHAACLAATPLIECPENNVGGPASVNWAAAALSAACALYAFAL